MSKKIAVTLAATTLLAACSSASGPGYSAWSVDGPNGEKAYRVDCQGIFEKNDVCVKRAQEICGNEPVVPLQVLTPLRDSASRAYREYTFHCGRPAVAKAPPPAPAPAPVVAPVAAPVQKFSLHGDTLFDFNRATLRPAAKQQLDEVIEQSKRVPDTAVTVAGYTDSIGSDAYNQRLSEARARSVADYLRSHGLSARRLEAHGYGKASPVASNATAEGRAKNRRVEILMEQ